MGIPIEKHWLDTLLSLSTEDKLELISMINGSIPPPEATLVSPATIPLAKRYGNATPAAELSKEERLAILDELCGAWKDSTPDDLAEQIINGRTISTREINLDD